MTRTFIRAAAVAAAVAGSAAAAAVAAENGKPGDSVRCEILASPVAGGVQLWAVADADRRLAGWYAFDVDKRSRAGTSTTRQSGPFEVDGTGRVVLSDVAIDLAGGAATARLELDWHSDRAACEATFTERTFERARVRPAPRKSSGTGSDPQPRQL
jgi:hypothetical protein